MKHRIYAIVILSMLTMLGYTQIPVRQTSDLEADMQSVFSDKRKMGNVEIVKSSTGKTNRSTNVKIKAMRDKWCKVDKNGKITQITMSKNELKDYSLFITFPGIPTENVGRTYWPNQKKMLKFNPKQDNIENFRLNPANPRNIKLSVLKKNEKRMDKDQFGIFPVSKHFHFPEGVSGVEQIVHSYSPFDYLEGRIPFNGEFLLSHRKSEKHVEIPFMVSFANRISWNGKDGIFVVKFLKRLNGQNYCHVVEIRSGYSQIVTCPFVIDASGINGKDGEKGTDGISGMDSFTITNKDGTTTTINGSCGTRGYNGENGENGENAGNVLVILDDRMKKVDVSIITKGGKGGKGGAGGQGGKHGNGSGCFGYAPSGVPGANGKDGKDGEQEVIRTDEKVLAPAFISNAKSDYISITLY
ncbi:MAG: hypothetical protein K5660_06855 [Paludibacteraceae bacterium]|nr:hypothetical protein [Paludibacteraceae bacterium]